MNIHEFGEQNTDILVILHGSCMVWDMYEESIDILKERFHVVVPALPGYDPGTDEDFTNVEQIVSELTDWLLAHEYREVCCLYGLSMGGSMVLRMLAEGRLKVDNAIVDGGITPYQMPRVLTRLIAVRDFLTVQLGRSSKRLLELAFPPERYTREGVDYMYEAMRRMSAKTVWRTFDSCNNYTMPDPIPAVSANCRYWYAEKEKKARKLDIAYIKQNFPGFVFREIPGMEHGEYCMMQPRRFAEDIVRFAARPETPR